MSSPPRVTLGPMSVSGTWGQMPQLKNYSETLTGATLNRETRFPESEDFRPYPGFY